MRFFLGKDGSAVVDKLAFEGESVTVDALVARYLAERPTFTATEVTEAVFNATPMDDAKILAAERAAAVESFLTNRHPISKVERAAALVTMDEINLIRQWIMSLKAANATATTYATLKTAIAALPNLADRNASQIRGAIQSKIEGGAAD